MRRIEDVDRQKIEQCRRMALDIYDIFKSERLDKDQALAGATAIMLWMLREKKSARETFQFLYEAQTALCLTENKDFFKLFGLKSKA
jgi:hypothetical protein